LPAVFVSIHAPILCLSSLASVKADEHQKEQYWLVTAYDRETHAWIRNMPRARRSSNATEVRTNPDGLGRPIRYTASQQRKMLTVR
jgi:hypothetical protein